MSVAVSDFQKQVVEQSRTVPVVVDFWATWCGPCKVLGPILERLEAEAKGGWILAKVDTDSNPALAQHYNIRGIPAVKMFINGDVANEFTGALPEGEVRRWLAHSLPDPLRSQVEEARAILEQGETGRAILLLEHVVSKEPGRETARGLLARALFLQNPTRAMELASTIEEGSEAHADAQAVRTLADLVRRGDDPGNFPDSGGKQDYLGAIKALKEQRLEDAVDGFIEVIRQNRLYDDDGARKACIAIFRILGDGHPVRQEKRRAFSSALY